VNVSQGAGAVKVNNELVDSFPKEYTFETDTQIKLEAFPDPGYLFNRWSGTKVGTSDNPITVQVNCDTFLTVTFVPMPSVLTIDKQGAGSISPYTGERNFGPGAVVRLKATPAIGWKFAGWTGHVKDPGSAETTVTLNSDIQVVGTFARTWLWPVYWILLGALAASAGLFWLAYKNRRSLRRSFRSLMK
jgi:hypothetical protein